MYTEVERKVEVIEWRTWCSIDKRMREYPDVPEKDFCRKRHFGHKSRKTASGGKMGAYLGRITVILIEIRTTDRVND